MFEIPQAKRVRRSDLYSTSSRSASPGSDHDNDKNGDVDGDTARTTTSTKTKSKGRDNSDDQAAAQAALASFFSSRFEFTEEGHSEQHLRSKDDDDKHSKLKPKKKARQTKDQTNQKPRNRDRDSNKDPKGSAVADKRRRGSNASSSSADFSADSRDSSVSESKSKSDHDRQDEQTLEEQPVHAFRLFAAPSTGDRNDVKSGREGAGESSNGKAKSKSKSKSKSSEEPGQARAQDGKDARLSTHAAVSHIVLDPTVADDAAAAANGLPGGFGSGGFLRARSLNHYRATPWTAAQRSACAKIVVTPEQLAAEAKTRYPGLIVPWRVSTIRMSKRSIRILQGWETGGGESGALKSGKPDVERRPVVEGHLLGPSGHLVRPDRTGKPRPGKKTRLMLRKKIREAAERKNKEAEAEEERRREKTRKNREKKVRRKLKAKEKEDEGREKEAKGEGKEEGKEGGGGGEERVTSVDVSMT